MNNLDPKGTNEQVITAIAEFCGWEKKMVIETGQWYWIDWNRKRKMDLESFKKEFNPLEDWNHWRQVEEKMMEDKDLMDALQFGFSVQSHHPYSYMKADLETRCKALYHILPKT